MEDTSNHDNTDNSSSDKGKGYENEHISRCAECISIGSDVSSCSKPL